MFFQGIQQDFKLALLPPVVCALFRLAFILVYREKKTPFGEWRKWYHCFRYGFWWGMDFNAYVFLFGLVLVSLPGAFLPAYYAVGDTVRMIGVSVYLAVLYTAFWGKMIFYYHFRDIYNETMLLGRNADKSNLADIFFRQNHGGWILLSFVPYLALCVLFEKALLGLPVLPLPQLGSDVLQYGMQAGIFVGAILLFYYCRYGGALNHANKPEWDEIPVVTKEDIFMAKATLDDLVAIELVWKRQVKELLRHTDEEARVTMASVMPAAWQGSPVEAFRRKAKGAKIGKPSHIFYIFGESYAQAPFDPTFRMLNLMEHGSRWRDDPKTFSIQHFLSAGLISQPSLVSVLSGIYDADLELNEREAFWHGTVPSSLPIQLRKLGYRTVFWYGGPLNWSSLLHFIPALGFDEAMDGFEICPKGSPRTWLGVYDHIFLEEAARRIPEMGAGEPALHFLYTTSIHGPYRIPVEKYGYDVERVMPDAPENVKRDKALQRKLGCIWYSDKAIMDFVHRMKELYPDSLFVLTGDHATALIPFDYDVIPRREPTVRERICTSFSIHHRDLTPELFAGNTIGGHMNILPTLMELIAPAGHEYLSLFPSLLEPLDHIVTPYHWLTRDAIGIYRDEIEQELVITPKELPVHTGRKRFQDEQQAWMELSGWIARHPELLQPTNYTSITHSK